jgi:hypothetical protein
MAIGGILTPISYCWKATEQARSDNPFILAQHETAACA